MNVLSGISIGFIGYTIFVNSTMKKKLGIAIIYGSTRKKRVGIRFVNFLYNQIIKQGHIPYIIDDIRAKLGPS